MRPFYAEVDVGAAPQHACWRNHRLQGVGNCRQGIGLERGAVPLKLSYAARTREQRLEIHVHSFFAKLGRIGVAYAAQPLRRCGERGIDQMANDISAPGSAFFRMGACWLGRQDSNLRMPVPKTGALPLGDAPADGRTGAPDGALIASLCSDERASSRKLGRYPISSSGAR